MPAPKRGPRLGAGPKHQKHLLANLASDLFRHGRVRTTETKAKTLRPYAERLITKAKQGDLHARRQVLSKLHDRDVVAYLFEEVAPRFSDRNGGYTRILKLGPRAGDAAPMAVIELVDLGQGSGEDTIEESRQRRSRGLFGRRRRKPAAPVADTSYDLDEDEDEELEDIEAEADEDERAADAADAAADADDATQPDEPEVGDPVDAEDTPDAGKGTGKDAGGA